MHAVSIGYNRAQVSISKRGNALKTTRYIYSVLESRWFIPGLAVSGTLVRLALIYLGLDSSQEALWRIVQ